jgi:hypothetical protein
VNAGRPMDPNQFSNGRERRPWPHLAAIQPPPVTAGQPAGNADRDTVAVMVAVYDELPSELIGQLVLAAVADAFTEHGLVGPDVGTLRQTCAMSRDAEDDDHTTFLQLGGAHEGTGDEPIVSRAAFQLHTAGIVNTSGTATPDSSRTNTSTPSAPRPRSPPPSCVLPGSGVESMADTRCLKTTWSRWSWSRTKGRTRPAACAPRPAVTSRRGRIRAGAGSATSGFSGARPLWSQLPARTSQLTATGALAYATCWPYDTTVLRLGPGSDHQHR